MVEVVAKPVRAKIEFTKDEYEEFIEGQIGYKIISNEIVEHRRWVVLHEIIIERLEDATFWRGHYSVGATESQWHDWEDRWNGFVAEFTQVFRIEKTVVVYT